MADLWRYFWIRETGTGQQVAQLLERYMMMMNFLHNFRKVLKYQISRKSVQWGPEFFQAGRRSGRQTDMTLSRAYVHCIIFGYSHADTLQYLHRHTGQWKDTFRRIIFFTQNDSQNDIVKSSTHMMRYFKFFILKPALKWSSYLHLSLLQVFYRNTLFTFLISFMSVIYIYIYIY